MPVGAELGSAKKHARPSTLLVVDPRDVANAEPVLGPRADPNLVASGDLALLDDA